MDAGDGAMIRGEAMTVRKGGTDILRDCCCTLQAGEMVAVIGPNGAGKTTLLNALTGSQRLSQGRVLVNGRPLGGWSSSELARQRAVLTQHQGLAFPFRCLDVVLMGRDPHPQSTASPPAAIAAWAMDVTGCAHLAERDYTSLSGGERQRIQLARVLCQIGPVNGGAGGNGGDRYLFLDEPTNNLDLPHQHELLRAARGLAGEGVGVLIILHDPNLAAWYADRVIVLHDGQKHSEGTPADCLSPRLFRDVFGMHVDVCPAPNGQGPVFVPRHCRGHGRNAQNTISNATRKKEEKPHVYRNEPV